MIRALPLLAPAALLLAGCALPEQAGREVDHISFGGDRLEVRLRDSSVCTAIVPLAGQGEGTFADCPDLSWSVDVRMRNLLEPIFGRSVVPYAHLVIRNSAGRTWAYKTPPPPGLED